MAPCTPTLAITPPAATISSQSSKSPAHRPPRWPCRRRDPPVSASTCRGGLAVGAVDRLPSRRTASRTSRGRLSSRSTMMICGRRVELRRQQRREADRTGADDRDRAARLYLAVEHAALEAGRQDVAQHDQRLFVGAAGDRVEAGVGVGRADVFGLRAVDLVAENPAAGRAVRVHAACGSTRICRRREMQEMRTRSPGLKAVTPAPTSR